MPMGSMYNATANAPKRKYQNKRLPRAIKRVDAGQNNAIINLQKKVRKIESDVEVKYWDTLHNGLAMTPAPGALSLLNPLLQSTVASSRTTRIGDLVQATSLQFRGSVLTDPQNLFGTMCRIIIFWDRQPNGTAPIFNQILDTTTVTSASSNTVYAPYNLKYAGRFKILKDKMFALNGQNQQLYTATTTTEQVPWMSHPIKFRIPLKRIVNYGLSNVGTIADISSNALYGMYLSTQTSGGDPPVLLAGVRFLFKDS